MARQTVHIEGLRELEKALAELPKAVGKSVLRRVLLKRAQPIASAAQAAAPKDEGTLERKIDVSTKLSKRQARLNRQASGTVARMTTEGFRSAAASSVEVFVGAAPLPYAHMQEFGTPRHGPQPYMRPAWEQNKDGVLSGLKTDLWTEIEKSARRLAARRAKAAAKG